MEMPVTIKVTPELLRNTASAIQNDMDHAQAVANQYLASQQNAMGGDTWSGGGAMASNQTAIEVENDLQKTLTGGTRLAEGLTQAAAIMESHEADSAHAFNALFGGNTVHSV